MMDDLLSRFYNLNQKEKESLAQREALVQPMLDPVDTLSGGLASIPKGAAVALTDFLMDIPVSLALEQMQNSEVALAALPTKQGMRKGSQNAAKNMDDFIAKQGDNSGMPGYNNDMRLQRKKSERTGRDYTEVHVVENPDIDEMVFSIDGTGQAVIEAPTWSYRDKDLIRNRGFRLIDEFLSPLESDQYIRMPLNAEDYRYLKQGNHRGSFNHATGEAEGGLSVAKNIELPHDYGYLVRGDRIGDGSDSEPLLDLSSAIVDSDLMDYHTLRAFIDDGVDKKWKDLGFHKDDLKLLNNPTYIFK